MNLITKARINIAYQLRRLANNLHSNGLNSPTIADVPSVDMEKKGRGRVVQVTAPAEYDFERANKPRKGGVVKTMPRSLRKLKGQK